MKSTNSWKHSLFCSHRARVDDVINDVTDDVVFLK
uniref:Uncharacterized protein n=1 Tax=Anguilla anguilla TaxID=7936 RepID=A0A0E9SI57_ANGAN